MQRKNVIMDETGRLLNLREDLPREDRYITQIITVKKAQMLRRETIVFRIESDEGRTIDIHLQKEKDISTLFNVFAMLEADKEEDMVGKEIICYLDIHFCTFGIGVLKDNEVERVERLVDFVAPYKEEQLIHQHIGCVPSDDEWERFCQAQA